ncbi:MAG: ATP-binding protein, partial [Desulfobacterales bacterium]|nr:ATP-binding protein [Desulfobacterales bacterium]
ADQGKLEQVIINLLLNAIDSVDQVGTIKISAALSEKEDLPFVLLTVEDDGNSIPETHLTRIFKPFYTTKTTGTGLGLANVHRVVDAHKGIVEVSNIEPLGVAFKVFIPIGGSDDPYSHRG